MRHCDRPSSGSRCGRPRKTLRTAALGPAITLPNTPAVCVSGAQLPLTLDMADECGMWAEYYKNGVPYGCRCRPWESAVNLEAIAYYMERAGER